MTIEIRDLQGESGYFTKVWKKTADCSISMGRRHYYANPSSVCTFVLTLESPETARESLPFSVTVRVATEDETFISALVCAQADEAELSRLCWAFVLKHVNQALLQQVVTQARDEAYYAGYRAAQAAMRKALG